MTVVEIETRPAAKGRVRRPSWPPWMEPILSDWRRRWPAAFTRPVPLAIGISRHIQEVLRTEGETIDRKMIGMALHRWTTQGAYLYVVARGERRRNLDGSAAGVPDEGARQHAQTLLDERAVRRAERERQKQEHQQTAWASGRGRRVAEITKPML